MPSVGQLLALGYFHGLLNGQDIESCDRRLTVELPPDGAVTPAEEPGEPGLTARAALVVKRDSEGQQVGRGHL